MSARIRRLALSAACIVLFVIFGIAAPYKIYKYYEIKQKAAAVAVPQEKL